METDLNRKIIISSDINDNLAKNVIERIIEINEYDLYMENSLRSYTPAPIEIYINSPGGLVSSGFAIIGAMEMSETPIATFAMGVVGSMALGIFMKGHYRFVHRYVRMMYHSLSYGEYGMIQDHIDRHKETNILQHMYDDLFKDTDFSLEKRNKIVEQKKNFFFSATEAVDMGMADEVIKEAIKVTSKNVNAPE